MKKKLLEKLSRPNIDRNFTWFWKKYIYPKQDVTYVYFMIMLNHPVRMHDDVKKVINEYLSQE